MEHVRQPVIFFCKASATVEIDLCRQATQTQSLPFSGTEWFAGKCADGLEQVVHAPGLREHAQPVVEPQGKSAVMVQLREQAQKLAQHNSWVLISGEAGAGKGTFARYIHDQSARRDGPFVEIAVGSISEENSAAELFGSEDGEEVHYGRLEQAHRADEWCAIDDMVASAQVLASPDASSTKCAMAPASAGSG